MNFQFRKFYDAGETENSGGGATETTQQTDVLDAPVEGVENKNPTEEKVTSPEVQEIPKQIFTDEEIKGFGFDSPDALKNFISQQLEKQKETGLTDEQRLEKANIEKAEFLNYAAKNKLLNVDDYSKYENLKSIPDKDLVYKNFKEEYKTDHPEITDEQELEEAAKEDFNYEYKLNSGSETVKKKGEAKLAKEAKEIRSPFESKVNSAQEKYKETFAQEKFVRDNLPNFEKFIDASIERNAPDKLVAYKHKEGDTEVDIDIPLSKEDKEAIAKTFKTPKNFNLFTSSQKQEAQKIIDNKIQGWLFQNKKNEIIARGIEIGKGIGTAQGSTTGAENPYPLSKGGIVEKTGEKTLEESNNEIAKARQNYKLGR